MQQVERWARWYDRCQNPDCSTPGKPHHAKGLCTTCYYRQYERKRPPQRAKDADKVRAEMAQAFKDALSQKGIVVQYEKGRLRLLAHGRPFFEHSFPRKPQ